MSSVKRTKLHDLLGIQVFQKKTVIIHISGNIHNLQGCHLILGREMRKLTRDTLQFSHDVETEAREQSRNNNRMHGYRVI